MTGLTFEAINAELLTRRQGLLEDWLPGGRV